MLKAEYPDKHPKFGEETIPLDGKTLLPVFEGNKRKPHGHLYWHWSTGRLSIGV